MSGDSTCYTADLDYVSVAEWSTLVVDTRNEG